MAGFTKLYGSILDSSIWEEDKATRIVWITFLAKADSSGNVIGVSKRLAKSANVSILEFESAIEKLTSPDMYSKTPDKEGRRLEKIPGGWHIVNYDKYRNMRDLEKRRKQNREAKRRQRKRDKELLEKKRKSAKCQRMSAQAEAEAEADKEKYIKESLTGFPLPPDRQRWKEIALRVGLTEQEAQNSYDNFEANGWKRSNGIEISSWHQVNALLRYWRNNRQNFLTKQTETKTDHEGKTRLFPIPGRSCGKRGCKMPAVYKDAAGDYDEYYCGDHMPEKVKEKFYA